MTWHNRIDFEQSHSAVGPEVRSLNAMTPGLTGTYDHELREKAGLHLPPPPPEYMGLEGEYDQFGLVRRLAQALDQEPDLAPIDTLTLAQHGSTLTLMGQVAGSATLDRLVDIARRLDGTRAVDIERVSKSHALNAN
jgi:hypothetical protein